MLRPASFAGLRIYAIPYNGSDAGKMHRSFVGSVRYERLRCLRMTSSGCFLGWCVSTCLELRPSVITEHDVLPLIRRKIPVACARLVVISAGAIRHGRRAPVVESHLQQSSLRNSDACSRRAAFDFTFGHSRSWRRTPEVP